MTRLVATGSLFVLYHFEGVLDSILSRTKDSHAAIEVLALSRPHKTNVKFVKNAWAKLKAAFALPEAAPALAFA